MSRGARSCIVALGLTLLATCDSGPDGEALALIEVSYAPDLPAFDQIWFSVEGQPTIATRKVPRADREAFTFGYAIAGLNGRYTVKAEARQGAGCAVGEGSATPLLTPGKNSERVKLTITRYDPTCAPPGPGPGPLSGGQVFDGPGPDDLDVQSANETMAVHWRGFGAGVAAYEYKIAPTADCEGTSLLAPIKVGTGASYSAFGLMLPAARVYNCIRSLDATGNASRWVGSDGIEIDRVAPTVVEYRPADKAADIKRGEPIVVVFSEALDPKSLTGQIKLESAGILLATKVELDGEGKNVSVRPEKPLPLLAALTLTVGAELRDRAGNALGKVAPASFTTADGVWSAPMEVFQYAQSQSPLAAQPAFAFAASPAGATVLWEQVEARMGVKQEMTSLQARRFDGATWGPVHEIARSPVGRVDAPAVAMDERGRTVILFRQATEGGRRSMFGTVFDPVRGWDSRRGPFEPLPMGLDVSEPRVAIVNGGLALGVWSWSEPELPPSLTPVTPTTYVPRISTTTQDGVDFTVATEVGVRSMSAGVKKLLPRVTADAKGNGLVVWLETGPAGDSLVSSRLTPTGGWGPPRVLAADPERRLFPLFDVVSDGTGNATLVWAHGTPASIALAFASHYDAATDKWSAPAPGSTSTAVPQQVVANASGQTAALFFAPPASFSVRRLERGVWAPTVKTRGGEAGSRLGIDDRGNLLLMWLELIADQKKLGIFVARESASGVSGKPLQLNREDGPYFDLAVLPDGRAFAVWAEGAPLRLMVSRFE